MLPRRNAHGLGFGEATFADAGLRRAELAFAGDHDQPGLWPGPQLPQRPRSELQSFEHEEGAPHEQGPGVTETPRRYLRRSRAGMGGGDALLDVKLALATMVEESEGGVAALLNLGQHETGADCMDRAGRDEDDIPLDDLSPGHLLENGAVADRAAQLCLRQR